MSIRSFAQAVVFGAVVALVAAAAQADVTWDAYNGFISGPNAQSASNTWQYLSVEGGGFNSGYTLLDRWGDNGNGVAINGWTNTQSYDTWHNQMIVKDTANGELRVHPYFDTSNPSAPNLATTIAWRSPITGLVDVSFSQTLRSSGGEGALYDGVDYWLYKSGAADAEYLEHGTVAAAGPGSTSGVITRTGISMVAGDMLYLQVDPRGAYNWDMTGVSMSVTSAVPEPSTIILVGTGVVGLLCYAWRKRK
jgi:hypothetical protein